MVLLCDVTRLGTCLLLAILSQGIHSAIGEVALGGPELMWKNMRADKDDVTAEVLLLMNDIINYYMPRCLRVQMVLDGSSANDISNYTGERSINIPYFKKTMRSTRNSLGYNNSQFLEEHPSMIIDLNNVKLAEYVTGFVNKNTVKATPAACVSYMLLHPPDFQLLPAIVDPSYGKSLNRYFLVHTQNSTEAEQFLLDQRLGKEENVAALVHEESQNKSYWRVLIRQLLHPSGSPQVLTVNRWSRDTGLTSTENIFPEQMANFHGMKLRAVSNRFMPYVAFNRIGETLVTELQPCIDQYLLDIIAQKLNFTYETVLPPDFSWGRPQKDGHFTGTVGEVEFGRANLSLLLSRTEDRAKVVDYTRVYAKDPLTFMNAKSLPGSPWRKILTPFRTSVWVCLLVSVGGGSLLYHVIYHAQATLTSSRLLSSHAFMHVLASFLSQSLHNYFSLQAGKVFLGFWFLYAFLVTSYYKTSLTSTLAVPFKPPAINTMLQLFQSDLDYGIKPTTSQHQYFSTTDNQLYRNMLDRMAFYSDEENIQRAGEGNYAFISFKSFLIFHSAVQNSNPRRKHDLRLATEEFYPGGFAWAVPMGAPYRRGFDEVMLRSFEAGLIEKWFSDLTTYYIREAREQRPLEEQTRSQGEGGLPTTTRQVAFSLNHLQGPFFMLLLGYGLGGVLLMVERVQINF